MLSPKSCKSCHPRHYREWSGSMHAYASDDPAFLAMNRRGQEETGGELGDFCVKCHAPMAVREGLTKDGLNLESLPREFKGVTCFFCHSTDAVVGDHNAALELASDGALRGGFADGVENGAHDQAYSSLHDRSQLESSNLCGACHDIVMPNGVHLERTFAEWKESFFNRGRDKGGLTCGNCHMPGTDGVQIADVPEARPRTHHEHAFPGLDVAVTEWPEKEFQLEAIRRDLEPAILPKLCYSPADGGKIEVTLDNIGAGHMLPSGAAAERRMWVELRAAQGDAVVLETGVVPADTAVAAAAKTDPLLWQIRDIAKKENGDIAHMFWEVASIDSELLRPMVTPDPADPQFIHSTTRTFALAPAPSRIDMVVHVRPFDIDIVDDLIASGHLDAAFRGAYPTFTIESTRLTWTPATAGIDLCVTPSR
jgi:hypothetical protein